MRLRHKVVVHQPRIKRDKTGSVSFGTMLELTKEQFEELNDAYYNGEELYLMLASEEHVLDVLREASEEFLNN